MNAGLLSHSPLSAQELHSSLASAQTDRVEGVDGGLVGGAIVGETVRFVAAAVGLAVPVSLVEGADVCAAHISHALGQVAAM